MTAAKCVTALLAFAVGMSIVSQAMAQSRTTGAVPKKITISKPKAAANTAHKPAAAPAMQVAAPKSAAVRKTTGPVVRTAAGRSVSRHVPAVIRGTRFGAVPVMPSPYAPPAEKLPPPPDDGSPRTLSFYGINTQETITVTYWRDGRYVQSELDRLNNFLRDSRNDDLVQMDPQLFDVLWHVQRNLGAEGSTWEVLSAYRSPQTNAWLASARRGVARDSLHMRGQAIDVKLPGRSPYQIRQAARTLGLGGVGYYPRSGFVHLDTGPVRYW